VKKIIFLACSTEVARHTQEDCGNHGSVGTEVARHTQEDYGNHGSVGTEVARHTQEDYDNHGSVGTKFSVLKGLFGSASLNMWLNSVSTPSAE
jgi:hypothetical protein